MVIEDETRVVLIGRTGNGKSATGNSLLDNPTAFNSSGDLCSVTGKTVRRSKSLTDSKTIEVIDTPGVFDTNTSEQDVIEELVKSIGLSSPGAHAFLYVLPVGNRLTNEESETLERYVRFFGKELYQFLIIVFTNESRLKGKTIEQYVQTAPIFFAELLKSCNNRIIAIENENHTEHRSQTVKRLLKMIQEMKGRSKSFYTHEMYGRSEKAIAQRLCDLGRGAKRSDVMKEIEAGGVGFKVLIAMGVSTIVGGLLVGTGVLIGGAVLASGAAWTTTAVAAAGSEVIAGAVSTGMAGATTRALVVSRCVIL